MTISEFLNEFTFIELTEDVLAGCEHFSCGVGDLDEYFQKDVLGYTRKMVSRLFASEEIESMSTRKDKAVVSQSTRLMYFDFLDLKSK